MDGRDLEWQVSDTSPRQLHVRSCDGRLSVTATILDNVYARRKGHSPPSVVVHPVNHGTEFPLGTPASDWPFRLGGHGGEVAPEGIIHTELVRSLVGRWSYRRRYRERQPRPSARSTAGGREAGPSTSAAARRPW